MTQAVTRWWLIRHAPVDAAGLIYGQLDLPADTGNTAAAQSLAARLPSSPVWLATPLQRTQQTAAAIQAARSEGTSPTLVPGLSEQHFGDWQGHSVERLMQDDAATWQRFWETPAESRPPNGESFADVVARVRETLTRLSAAYEGRDIVAAAHGGSIRAALAAALDIPAANALSFVIDTWSLTRLDFIHPADANAGAWRVGCVNQPAL